MNIEDLQERIRTAGNRSASHVVQGGPVGWYTEDHLDDKSATTYKAEVAQRWRDKGWPVWSLYAAPQPAECTLNSDREQVTEIEAPNNSLPSWSECNLRVGNSEWLKDNDREAECDSLTANPLHEFIYEYDDLDAYKSAWFLHRLEKLIGFIRSEQHPVEAQLVEALEELIDLMEDIRHGEYTPDSFTTQPARDALATYRQQGGDA